MSLSTFTTLHVVISLIAIATGVICMLALLGSKTPSGLTSTFLLTTVATSVTGFFFPNLNIGPPVIFGIVSLIVLTPVLLAYYRYRLVGPWRWIYIVGAAFALYLNSVVAVVQSFQKLSFLKPLAPTQSEPPFLVAQVIVLVIIVGLAVLGIRRFHPQM